MFFYVAFYEICQQTEKKNPTIVNCIGVRFGGGCHYLFFWNGGHGIWKINYGTDLVYGPEKSIGASIGAVVSDFLRLTEGNANLLILVGMTGFLTSVTRAPFTSAIIIFEMTDRHSIIFYLLFGAVISNIIASITSRKSFYDAIKESYLKEVDEMVERPGVKN